MARSRYDGPFIPSRGPHKGKSFASYFQYRSTVSKERGFAGYRAERLAPRPIKSVVALERLSPAEQERYARALHAVADMRDDPTLTLKEAARRNGVSPDAVRRYAGDALERRGGRLHVTSNDRLARRLRVAVANPGRVITLTVRDSRTASLIGRHWAAIGRYLDKGDASALRAFRRKVVTVDKVGYLLLTDTRELDWLRRLGELSFENLYQLAA